MSCGFIGLPEVSRPPSRFCSITSRPSKETPSPTPQRKFIGRGRLGWLRRVWPVSRSRVQHTSSEPDAERGIVGLWGWSVSRPAFDPCRKSEPRSLRAGGCDVRSKNGQQSMPDAVRGPLARCQIQIVDVRFCQASLRLGRRWRLRHAGRCSRVRRGENHPLLYPLFRPPDGHFSGNLAIWVKSLPNEKNGRKPLLTRAYGHFY